MELRSDQYVVFNVNGKEVKAGHLWATWNRKENAFYILDDNNKPIFSTDIRTKAPRKRTAKKTTSQMVEIEPDTSTAKAYGIAVGTNGCVSRGNRKTYYKWIAKSICDVRDGKIYAPIWAVR